jgi:hypothetical protein
VSHRFRGGSNQPEALHPVALGIIPGDHAQVCKGQGASSSGLGASDEKGPPPDRSREGRQAAAEVTEAHSAVPMRVAAYETCPQE